MRAGLRSVLLKPGGFVLPQKGAYSGGALLACPQLGSNADGPFVRNNNTPGDALEIKGGPHHIVRQPFTSGWRMYIEAIEDRTPGSTTFTGMMLATAPAPQGPWTFAPTTLLIEPTVGGWEQEEISPSSAYWQGEKNRWVVWYHGGNNAGPRQIGVMYSTDGVRGQTFIRDPANPIIRIGAGGASDDAHVSDLKVIRLPDLSFLGFYCGRDGTAVTNGTIHKVTGTSPNMLTKRGEVIQEGAPASWNEAGNYPSHPWRNALTGRLHMFLTCGDTGNGGIGGYYSDDLGATWAAEAGNPLITGSGGSTNYDSHVGDVGNVALDGDLIAVTTGTDAFTFATNAPMRGQSMWVTPLVNASPSRTGKFYHASAETRITATSPLTSTIFTIMGRFRAVKMNRNTYRTIYSEYAAFNIQIYIRIHGGGGANAGKLAVWVRTPTGFISTSFFSAAVVDDGLWHTFAFVRTATNAFEMFVDGVSQGTDATTVGTDVTATIKAVGNWNQVGTPAAPANEAAFCTVSDLGVSNDTAYTAAQATAWINGRTIPSGTIAVDFPTAGTPTGNVINVEAAG